MIKQARVLKRDKPDHPNANDAEINIEDKVEEEVKGEITAGPIIRKRLKRSRSEEVDQMSEER
jgi:hypothetical protein